jgi:hypothetical protein
MGYYLRRYLGAYLGDGIAKGYLKATPWEVGREVERF